MATLTTSFNIIVKTNAQIWDDIAQAVKDGNVRYGETFSLKFTDGTSTVMEVIDVDETTGDAVLVDTNGVDVKFHNEETPSTDISWNNCSGRTYLNGEYLNKIPSNIRNKIKQKAGKYYKCANSTTPPGYNGNITEILTITDTIWIPIYENIVENPNANYTPIQGEKTYGRYKDNSSQNRYGYNIGKSWALASPVRRIPSSNTNYANKLYCMMASGNGISTMNGLVVSVNHGLIPHFILPGT